MFFKQYITHYINEETRAENSEQTIVEVDGWFEYHINNGYINETDTVVVFNILSISETDSSVYESPLYINDKGMFLTLPAEVIEMLTHRRKNFKKKDLLLQTIQTPLYEGLTWTAHDYSLLETTYTCTNIDTVLEIPAGKMNAFAISTSSTQSELTGSRKDYVMISKYVSYYAQGIGKIAEYTTAHLKHKDSDKMFLMFTIELELQEVWWDD